MSRLLFKNQEYTYGDLLGYFTKGISFFQSDKVLDLETGESCDISAIRECFGRYYIQECMTKKDINTIHNRGAFKILNKKYLDKVITKDEMLDYLKIIKQDGIIPSYKYGKGYLIVNLNKIPIMLSKSDFWGFYMMLNFLSTNHMNRISHSNQHPISRDDIRKYLKYSSNGTFKNFLSRLRKHNLIKEDVFGGVRYLIVNPAYAKKNMKLDGTIYKMFKKDLDECLTEEQIYYLNMLDDTVEIESMTALID